MRVVVSHLSGAFAGKRELFEGDRLTIGRARVNVVRLGPHDTVSSSKHAELVAERGGDREQQRGERSGPVVDARRLAIVAFTERNRRRRARGAAAAVAATTKHAPQR